MNKKLLTILTISATIISLVGYRPALATNPPILITEVQTGFIDGSGAESPKQEFIEITNVSSLAVNLTGWRLEYLSASNDGSGTPTQVIDTLNGQIGINGHGLWEHEGYYPAPPDAIFGVGDTSSSGFLAKSGGHVRLMNGTTMIDCVSWGSAVAIAGCDKVSALAGAGYTIQRRLNNGTYDKITGVANLTPATPQGGNIYSLSTTPPVVNPPTNPVQPTPAPDCDGVQLSEILANPAGDDGQGEFIELYNPLDHDQSLYGCSLRLASGKEYAFTTLDTMMAHEYKAYPYSSTALQLSNSGGTVTLITVGQQASTTYPTVGDDDAWALVNGVWNISKQPTPNAANVASSSAESASVTSLEESAACPEGKYRNPDTGRCRNIPTDNPLTACPEGQERNLTTGRCRKSVVTATQAVCQPGQERNPDTSRCKKVETAATQKPCDPGQERSLDTNRCRKVTSNPVGKVLGSTTVHTQTYHYLIVGLVLSGVVGYGVYEYRHDLIGLIGRFRKKPANP